MGEYFNEYRTQEDILDRVKKRRVLGAMRRTLCEVFEGAHDGKDTGALKWMYYAGMGDVDFSNAEPHEERAVKNLMNSGMLVPTFENQYYSLKYRLIQHFDDVKFAFDENESILIYDLGHNVPDAVIRPDERHDAAIKALRSRMHFPSGGYLAFVDTTPIQLNGGPLIRPIHTDLDMIKIRQRQLGLA